MKILILLSTLAVAFAAGVDDCSNLKVAQERGAVNDCLTIWKNVKPKQDNDEECTFCQEIIKDVRAYLEDKKTQDMIQKYLDEACAVIPDKEISTECKDLIDNYLDTVLTLIASELDPQTVCSLMGLCSGFKGTVSDKPVLKLPRAEPICTDCKKFFGDIKNMITDPGMEKELETMLKEELCAQMGSFQDTCNELVDQYLPEILDLLASEFDPSMICGSFGFCNSPGRGMLQKMRLQKSPLFLASRKEGSAESCAVCKAVFGELQNLDKDKDIQADIENFVKNNLCSRLGSLKDECIATVDLYAPELFELLVNELDPQTRCDSLGFCVDDSQNSVDDSIRKSMPKTPMQNVLASTECVLCEFVMKEIDQMLSDNATETEIIAIVDKVCSLLPGTLSSECKDFVDTYGPAIILLLEQELKPELVCQTLGLCPSSHTRNIRKPIRNGEECGVCETVVQYLDSLLEENSTVDVIEKALDKVCNFLPDTIRAECNNFVDEYSPQLIQCLVEFMDPKEVCTLIGLCGNDTKTAQKPMLKLIPGKAHLLGDQKCTWGPSYWCRDENTAKACQAVDHCKNKVWKNL